MTRKLFNGWSIEYTTKPSIRFTFEIYRDDDRIVFHIALWYSLWLSLYKKYTRDTWKVWFSFNHIYMTLHYWFMDLLEEEKNHFIFFYDRITRFFFWRDNVVRWELKDMWDYEMIMNHWDKYKVHVEMQEMYSFRKRIFYWRYLWTRWEITPDRWIPTEWKWENSWDCGEDATYSMSTWNCAWPNEAVQELKESVERTRIKYWVPRSIKNPSE